MSDSHNRERNMKKCPFVRGDIVAYSPGPSHRKWDGMRAIVLTSGAKLTVQFIETPPDETHWLERIAVYGSHLWDTLEKIGHTQLE